ncbi:MULTISPECIES: hypothetical protein [Mesorhizobium]|uniref:Uncharacterized protein n=2 Tax=Mesorhizobium TaxID=68287 RepID=A0A1A5HVX7_RHILI|nr:MULTISPECIES: hypothetical protein [Mesorhizobium]ETA72404.1 hypothetical protein MesloDRAFT_1277 [Mesorhizobium japonicum R7A]MBE1709732.1 hypothetical protein [Mesorhizobium japonicum]MBE1714401.1 hypothetical protein [Mesorhizobium japonicum]MUT22014.1 hypothetical protein [Mesorhizobium japonicum]MUT28565.1 hypothetical protein [Mesorhizobium japonicum]
MTIDFGALRGAISRLDASASSSTTGQDRPVPEQIFAPEHHVGALDANTTIVFGSRGSGKSFWAGVLAHADTRKAAAEAYPRIGLDRLLIGLGFTGQDGDGSVSRATINSQVPAGTETERANLLWRCVVLRAVRAAISPGSQTERIGALMQDFQDPEAWEEAMHLADSQVEPGARVVIIFDALDSLAVEWHRLRELTDALLEVAWSIRGYRSIRAKLFLRPDQVQDLGLRFVELPKMVAGATKLVWSPANLYGMFFSRIATDPTPETIANFRELLIESETPPAPNLLAGIRRWALNYDRGAQARVFNKLAGLYMGRSHKKGRTYDWPINHLADGHGEVTPRSFLTLMRTAAETQPFLETQAVTAEGIRNGLRSASKVRLEQLDTEFKWIKRVLAPLARIQVPCTASVIIDRWNETQTVEAVMTRAAAKEFLPPFESKTDQSDDEQLIDRLTQMGVLTKRSDGRYDMPDLFRVAARLLRKGGVAPAFV